MNIIKRYFNAKNIFLYLGVIFSINFSYAQDFAWAKSMGGTSYEWTNSIIVENNNVYNTGHFTGTVDFDPSVGVFNLTSSGQEDAFISKYDGNGNFVWAKSVTGFNYVLGSSIVSDGVGNIYITGYYMGTADFDPGVGTYNLTSTGQQEAFVLKLDTNGNFLWAKSFGGSGQEQGESILIDAFGNLYIVGHFDGVADFDPGSGVYNLSPLGTKDLFILKLDNNGDFVWVKNIGGGYVVYPDATLDNMNNICITGVFRNTVDFDPGTGTYNLSSSGINDDDIFIVKLDNNGNFLWANSVGGSGQDYGYAVTTDNLNNVYFTGWYNGTVDFNSGVGTYNLTATGNADIFISKLDASGNFIWAKSIGGTSLDFGLDITIDSYNNVYSTGWFGGTTDFDPGIGTYNLIATGNNDIFISKLDASGNFVWAKNMGGSGYERGNTIFVENDSTIYVGGYYQNTVDFDPGPNTYNMTAVGQDDIFILKLGQCTPSYFVDTISSCDSITWLDNVTYTSSTNSPIYTIVGGAYNGCDSVINLNLTIHNSTTNNQNISICQGDSVLISGTYQNTAGTYYDSLQTVNGCDSVIATTLTINPNYFNTNYDTICQGDSILIGGVYQNTAGTYYDSLQTVNGCDSVVEIILSVDTSLTAYFTKAIDPNDSLNLLITNLATGNNLQYLWDFGDGNTSSQAYPNHTYATIGVYNLCLTITDSLSGCSSIFCDSTTVMRTTGVKTIQVISSTTSIDEVDYLDNISLFPNPTQNIFTLNLIEIKSIQILVTSIEGKIMYNKVVNNNHVEIDASKWANGLYFVNVMIDNQQKVFKLIKQ